MSPSLSQASDEHVSSTRNETSNEQQNLTGSVREMLSELKHIYTSTTNSFLQKIKDAELSLETKENDGDIHRFKLEVILGQLLENIEDLEKSRQHFCSKYENLLEDNEDSPSHILPDQNADEIIRHFNSQSTVDQSQTKFLEKCTEEENILGTSTASETQLPDEQEINPPVELMQEGTPEEALTQLLIKTEIEKVIDRPPIAVDCNSESFDFNKWKNENLSTFSFSECSLEKLPQPLEKVSLLYNLGLQEKRSENFACIFSSLAESKELENVEGDIDWAKTLKSNTLLSVLKRDYILMKRYEYEHGKRMFSSYISLECRKRKRKVTGRYLLRRRTQRRINDSNSDSGSDYEADIKKPVLKAVTPERSELALKELEALSFDRAESISSISTLTGLSFSDTSSSSDEEEEAEAPKAAVTTPVKPGMSKAAEGPGRIVSVNLQSLLPASQNSTNGENYPENSSPAVEEKESELSKISQSVKTILLISSEDGGISSSDAEINRLANLSNLNKKKADSTKQNSTQPKLKKKTRRKSKNELSTSNSDTSDSESALDHAVGLNVIHPIGPADVLMINSSCSSIDETPSDEHIDSSPPRKKKNSKTKILASTSGGSTENDSEVCDSVKKKPGWKNDKLLRVGKLKTTSDSSSSFSGEDSSKKRKRRRRRAQVVGEKKRRTEKQLGSSSSFSSSTSDSGDVEFVEERISSSDSDIEFISNDVEISNNATKGRRNIRRLLDDRLLNEATKQATKEEEEKKKRLFERQSQLDELLSQSQEETGLVLDVDEETKKPILVVDKNLTSIAKDHQKKGIRFMWDCCFESVKRLAEDQGSGCILAHCMGLGKTFQVFALIHTLLSHEVTKNHIKTFLVVCPVSTVPNWMQEGKWILNKANKTNAVNLFRFESEKPSSKAAVIRKWKDKSGMLILGYEQFVTLLKEDKPNEEFQRYKKVFTDNLLDPGPDVVICDEGHLLKSGKGLKHQALIRIGTKRRIVLTGTPMQNNLLEYYYMVNFVKPNLLGSVNEYCNRFVNPIYNGQFEDSTKTDIALMKKRSHVLYSMLNTTIQRYEVTELKAYLPEKFEYTLFVKLSPLQIQLYNAYPQTERIFLNFHNLRYVWCHPRLLYVAKDQKKKTPILNSGEQVEEIVNVGDWWKKIVPADFHTNVEHGTKMLILLDIIRECEKQREKMLVFSSSLALLDSVEYFIKEHCKTPTSQWIVDRDYCRMDGKVPPERRLRMCNNFNNLGNKRLRLFLLSPKVGGLGLNLAAASRVVLMDVSWNPAHDNQSIFRMYRFGQTKPCIVYRLVALGTMEEVVYKRSVTKQALSKRVVDQHQLRRHYKANDLQQMYRFTGDVQERPTPKLPKDKLLAYLLQKYDPGIYSYQEHEVLLERLQDEDLDEEEKKLAWEEYKRERESAANKNVANNNNITNIETDQNVPFNEYAVDDPLNLLQPLTDNRFVINDLGEVTALEITESNTSLSSSSRKNDTNWSVDISIANEQQINSSAPSTSKSGNCTIRPVPPMQNRSTSSIMPNEPASVPPLPMKPLPKLVDVLQRKFSETLRKHI